MNHTNPTSANVVFPNPPHAEKATDLFVQKQTAMGYIHTQLRNISEQYLPRPDEKLRKECEALGFVFHDNKTRDKKNLVKTSLPDGWHIQMPDDSNPRNCFWFRIMDQFGRARYEIFYNANPHRDRYKAEIRKMAPYELHIIHEYPIKNKSGMYLTSEGYRAVVLDSNDNFVEDLGFVHCGHRNTREFESFSENVHKVFAEKYTTTFCDDPANVCRTISISPNFSDSNIQRLLQIISLGAMPRPDAKNRTECEKMGFVFHDEKSFADVKAFENAAIYEPMLIFATLPAGWTITPDKNKGISGNLWFTVSDANQQPRLHFYFVNAEQTPGLLHATLRII
jgi:hypothetical protein